MDDFKAKLTQYMMSGDREFRYKVYDANLKEFSDEIQAVAKTYGQWESFRSMNIMVQSCG